ncbi:DUF4214 domain-containing protein [Telmatocola sphagniphila]|uniref:DUF4214 domain-containing protein n=1 Tax=Telmatocola sphagniphila TaxID=1123043 RepID=A0A8E6EUL2_9BACT|nr:DUF4214 domain-containing protein [Telmatocola sphagniphila]QVL33844.1 DUF4214 domain-containing protein [Telmatocola sphagniphila]
MASPLSWLKRCWVDQALSVKPVRRHKLGVQLLEDRVVPANVDVFYNVGYGPYADLQFQGNFPATTPQTTTVTSTSAVTAGFYVPGGEVKGNFVPFFSFPNGLTLSNLSFSNSNNSFFGTVTISTQVMAAILSNGSQTTNQTLVDTGTGNPYLFTMSDLVNDTDIKIPNADAVPFQIGGQTFVPGDFFVNYSTSSGHTYDSAYLSLGGVLGLSGFTNAGLQIPASSLAINENPFYPSTSAFTFIPGVYAPNNTFSILPVFQDANGGSGPFTFTLDGLTFQSSALTATVAYSGSGGYAGEVYPFNITGTATAEFDVGSASVTFGTQAQYSGGLQYNNGQLSILQSLQNLEYQPANPLPLFTINSLTIGDQSFTAYPQIQSPGLFLGFNTTENQFTIQGMAQTVLTPGVTQIILLGVNEQGGANQAYPPYPSGSTYEPPPGTYQSPWTITNGALDPISFQVTLVNFGGLSFFGNLTAIYDENSASFDLSGSATASLQGGHAQVTFGSSPPGIVANNGTVSSISFSLNSLTLGGITYTPAAVDGLSPMSAVYDPNSQAFSFVGGATTPQGNADLGADGTSGFVLDSNGNVTASTYNFFSPSGSVSLNGLTYNVTNLTASFNPTSGTTIFQGQATIPVSGQNLTISGTGTNYIFGIDQNGNSLSNFQVAGPLSVQPLTFTPYGLYSQAVNATTIALLGTASLTLDGQVIPVTLGVGQGVQIVNGVISSVSFSTPSINVAGVQIQSTSGFVWSSNFSQSTLAYTIQGSFNLNADGLIIGPVTGNFNYTQDPTTGNGVVTLASNTYTFANTQTLDNVVFNPGTLSVTYDPVQNQFTFSGTGNYFGQAITVGGAGNPSISLVNGNLQLNGFNPPPLEDVQLPSLGDINISGLNQVVNPDLSVTVTGSTTLQVGSATFSLNLGGGGTTGLTFSVSNGQAQIISLGAQLTGKFTVGNLTINVESLTLEYDVPSDTITIDGTANATFKAASQTIKVELQLGEGTTPGIVLQNGQLQSLEASITSDFSLFGVKVHIKDAGVEYDSTNSSFGIFGTVILTTAPKGGHSVLNNFGVSLGSGPDDPGIEIVDGSLQSLDIELDGSIDLDGVTATSKGLTLQYDSAASTLQITGGLQVSLASGFTGTVSLPGQGLLINTSDGSVQLLGLEIKIADLKLGPIGIQDLEFEYAQDSQGNTTISGSGMVSLPGGITVGGSFEISNGQLSEIGISFSRTPGIPIGDFGYITSISGQVSGLNDLADDFEFDGSVTGTFGPSIKIYNKTEAAATVTGSIKINAKMMEIDGDIEYLGGLYGKGSGKAIFYFTGPNLINISGSSTIISIPPYGSVLTGNLAFDLDKSGDITFNGGFNVTVPSNIPKIGGKSLGTLTVYLQIRPEQSASNSYAQFTASVTVIVKISATLKVDLTGEVQGSVSADLGIFGTYSAGFSFYLPGTRTVIVDGSGAPVTYQIAPDTSPASDSPPTLALSASPESGSPAADIDYTGTTSYPTDTTIDIYADTNSSGYNGQLIASDLPFKAGQQSFEWDDFAEFASQPYDPTKPIYFYGVIKDGTNPPVYTAYTSGIIPPDYDPTVTVPTIQNTSSNTPIEFSSASGNAIVVTDPMEEFDNNAQVQVIVHANSGSFQVSNFQGDVTLSGQGSNELTLVGPGFDVSQELDGMIYTPQPGAFFKDSVQVAVSRYQGEFTTPITSNFGVTIYPLSLVLGDPNAGNPNDTQTPSPATNVSYTLGSGPAPLLEQLQVEDAEDGMIRGASVSISNYVQGQDFLILPLKFQQQTGITATFNMATGVLSLSGTEPVNMYQIALDDVQYNSSGTPSNESLVIALGDDSGNQASLTEPIVTKANNSPPVVAPLGIGLLYMQGDAPAALDPGITVSNPQGGQIVAAVISFYPATYNPGEDELLFTNQNGISGAFDSAKGVLTLSGNATAADYTAALQSIQYVDLSGSVTPGFRELTVSVINDNSTKNFANATERLQVSSSASVPQTPVVTLSTANVTASTRTNAVVLDKGLTVSDSEAATLLGAHVAISGNYSPGEDSLNATQLFGGIQESFDVNTGILTLSGESSVYDYQIALASVTFTDLVQARSGLPRTISFSVNDGLTPSANATLTLTVPVIPYVTTGFVNLQVTAGRTAFAIDPTVTINYSGATLSGATISFPGVYFSDEDQLIFTNQNGITGNFDSATGVLSLSGTASIADYQTALQSIEYYNSRVNPIAGSREVDFSISDGSVTSLPAYVVVDVNAADVPPTLSVPPNTLQFVQNGTPLPVAPTLSIQDPDPALPDGSGQHTIYNASVSIGNYVPGEDLLSFTPSGGITGTFNATQGILQLSGAATEAQYEAVLESVQYQDVSPAPVTTPRTITFSINDGMASVDTVNVTVDVKSLLIPPTQTAGSINPLNLLTNAAPISLGLGSLNFATPSTKEPYLIYTVTQVPGAIGQVMFSDGTVAAAGQTYTLAQIQSANFEPKLNASGSGNFTFTVAGFNPILNQPDPTALTRSVPITVSGTTTKTSNELFVAQLYRDLLNRNGSLAELDGWAVQLDAGVAPSTVVTGIESSKEYRADQINALYESLLHRSVDVSGQTSYLGDMQKGATIEQIRVDIASSPEFYRTQGNSSPTGFVEVLYQDILNRTVSTTEAAGWIQQFTKNNNRVSVVEGIANSSEAFQDRTLLLYQQLLRRQPEQSGLTSNATQMAKTGEAAVVATMAGSVEYYSRYTGGPDSDLRSDASGNSASVSTNSSATSDSSQPLNEEGNAATTTGFASVGIVNFSGQGVGGGTLIAPRFVLTAAHVIDGRDPSTLTFTVGGATYNVAKVFEYPEYDPAEIGTNAANDIAVLELTKSVLNVAPSPINESVPAAGQLLTLVGFGARDGDAFGVKHKGTTPIGNVTSTLLTWTYQNNQQDDTVVGDSGSPEFVLKNGVYYIAGITSGGTQTNSSFGDNEYNTRVDVYASWIDSIAGL